MDTGTEERERGVTVDIAQHHFSTESADFTILDAPGHRDFVPNMIGGASMADLAVLVVDANQLESGMKGQTREHILLAKAVGIKKIVVAVNKLDSAAQPWSQELFKKVKAEVLKLLNQTGFSDDAIKFVPCSGLSGENVAKSPSSTGAKSWLSSHPTLLKALEASIPEKANVETTKQPFRMRISDVFRGGITNPLSVSGRITAGNVQVGDALTVQPSGESATVRGIDIHSDGREWAVAGEICNLHVTDIDPIHLRTGDVISSSSSPAPVVKQFEAGIDVLEPLLSSGVDVHLGRLHAAGAVSQLIALLDDKGEVLRKKPRILKPGQRARVQVKVDEAVPLAGEHVILRSAGTTVAYGLIA
jgi:elongation factor 1 alpha-like protein